MTHKTRHTLILALLLALLISIAPAGIAQEMDTNTALVENYIAAWNMGDTSTLAGLLADDHITQTPLFDVVEGMEAVAELVANTRTAIPDYTFTIGDISDFDGQVYVEGTITGTHSGPLMLSRILPIVPSDNEINVRAMLIVTIVESRISRVEWIDDTFTMMTQMGAAKPPADVLKEQRNSEVIQTWVETLYTGDSSAAARDGLAELYHDSVTRHTPNNRQIQQFSGSDYAAEQLNALNTAFPEREFNVVSLTASGDYVTLVYEVSGLFAADMPSPNGATVTATGEEYGWDGAFVFRLEDGLIAEEWWYWDNELFAMVDYGYAD